MQETATDDSERVEVIVLVALGAARSERRSMSGIRERCVRDEAPGHSGVSSRSHDWTATEGNIGAFSPSLGDDLAVTPRSLGASDRHRMGVG